MVKLGEGCRLSVVALVDVWWPDQGDGYQLYDALQERNIGRILFDAEGHWIYDGHVLTLDEQEEIAGFVSGNHKEMNDLISSIK